MSKIAIIGGTGLAAMPELEIRETKRVGTPYGVPSSALVCGVLCGEQNGREVVFLARHGEEHSIPPHRVNYRANIAALKEEGVSHIIAVNAVGGIRADLRPGMMVLPDQVIDYTFGREHTYWDSRESEMQHVDFTNPYDETVRQALLGSLNQQGESFVCSGVHGVTQGPRLESTAEVDRLERDGCDIVGMTGMPEASLAREAGIAYASLALVVNPAAGRCREAIGMDQILLVIDEAMPKVRAVISAACGKL